MRDINVIKRHELPSVFIINMPSDIKRREAIDKQLSQTGLGYEFVAGVDMRGVAIEDVPNYDRIRRLRNFGRDLQLAELGCSLSHRKVFKKMMDEGIKYAVVLEDDVVINPEFEDVLAALMQCCEDWDLVRFLGSEKIYRRGCRKITRLTDNYWLARLPTAPGGAHGYLISLKAARRYYDLMEANWIPYDTLQGRGWETGVRALTTYPAPLYPDVAQGTTIGDKRFDKTVTVTGLTKMLFPITRAWYKITDSMGKKFDYWVNWLTDKRIG